MIKKTPDVETSGDDCLPYENQWRWGESNPCPTK